MTQQFTSAGDVALKRFEEESHSNLIEPLTELLHAAR